MTSPTRLTRRPAEDVPGYVLSAWDVLDRETRAYLGWVEATEEVDYRRKGSRHGTPGTGYVSGKLWTARLPGGRIVPGSSPDNHRSSAVNDLYRYHQENRP